MSCVTGDYLVQRILASKLSPNFQHMVIFIKEAVSDSSFLGLLAPAGQLRLPCKHFPLYFLSSEHVYFTERNLGPSEIDLKEIVSFLLYKNNPMSLCSWARPSTQWPGLTFSWVCSWKQCGVSQVNYWYALIQHGLP